MGASPTVGLTSEELARKLVSGGGGEGLSSADLATKLTSPAALPPPGPLPGSTARLREAVGAPEEPGFLGQLGTGLKNVGVGIGKHALTNAALGPVLGTAKTAYDIASSSLTEGTEGASPLGAIPIIGPLAGQLGRDIGERNYGGAMVTGGMLGATVAPSVLPAAKGIRTTADYMSPASRSARRVIRDSAVRAEGEAELTSLIRSDAHDPSFREAHRVAMPRVLDEVGGGKGVRAGLETLAKMPENQVFEVAANAAKNAARRLFAPIENEMSATAQQPVTGIRDSAVVRSLVRGEIESQISDGFRSRYPGAATRLEEIGNKYAQSGPTTRGEVFKDFVDVSQELKALESKAAMERSAIIRADPEWGYLVGLKNLLRKKAFEGLPAKIYEQYKEYGKAADIRDELMDISTVMQGHLQQGKLAAAREGLETAALGAGMGRGGTLAYGTSKAVKGIYGVANPAKQFIRALRKINYDDPLPGAEIPQLRGLLGPGPTPMGPADIPPGNTGYAMPAELLRDQRALPDAGAQIPLGPANIAPGNTGFATPNELMRSRPALPPGVPPQNQMPWQAQSSRALPPPQPSPYPPPAGQAPAPGQPPPPVHQQFLGAFEALPGKDLPKAFHNLGPTRSLALEDWLTKNNMVQNYPRLSGALKNWLADINRKRGLGPKGEILP